MTSSKPKYIPIFFKQKPYNLPKTAPRMKDGVSTPAGIGEHVASMIRMNFLKRKLKLLYKNLQNAIDC